MAEVQHFSAGCPDVSVGLRRGRQTGSTRVGVGGFCFFLRLLMRVFSLLGSSPGDRSTILNNTEVQVDFKSHQWFGATVRTHGDTILVRRFGRN